MSYRAAQTGVLAGHSGASPAAPVRHRTLFCGLLRRLYPLMPHVYESAQRHQDSDFPENQSAAAAYTPGGFLLVWLLHNGMVTRAISDRLKDDIARLNAGQVTAGELFEAAGGVLSSDMLTTTGNSFGLGYIDRFYFEDYTQLFSDQFAVIWDVEDNDEHLQIVCEMLDAIYDDFADD